MKTIKLWSISAGNSVGNTAVPLEGVETTATENRLEELLIASPDLLMPDLNLVGRQTETAGGPLDLLGVDADGALVVFELKRGMLTRDAVAQVVDYASDLAEMDMDDLCRHISDRSGQGGIDKIADFRSWYQSMHNRDVHSIGKPRLVLVGLGADQRARRMVEFLADSDIDISLLTFHAFRDGDKLLLARQVEVEARTEPSRSGYNKRNNLQRLQTLARQDGVDHYFFDIATCIRNTAPAAYEWPNVSSYAYSLPEPTDSGNSPSRTYFSLYIEPKPSARVRLYFHRRAVNAAEHVDEDVLQRAPVRSATDKEGGRSIIVNSEAEWAKARPWLETAIPALLKGWQAQREAQTRQELQEAEESSSASAADDEEENG